MNAEHVPTAARVAEVRFARAVRITPSQARSDERPPKEEVRIANARAHDDGRVVDLLARRAEKLDNGAYVFKDDELRPR